MAIKFRLYILKPIHILDHVVMVNSRCYGRCHVKKTYTTVYLP